MNETLTHLFEVAKRQPPVAGRTWRDAFMEIGLILHEALGPVSTVAPANSVAFASTGGDGVHFSFLSEGGAATDASAVVMSIPETGTNIVVGKDLREFLALGTRFGFQFLPDIAFSRDRFAAAYLGGEDVYSLTPSARALLDVLKSEFGVSPWTDIDARLKALEGRLLGQAAPPAGPTERAGAIPMGAMFWKAMLEQEERRPPAERDLDREAHMRRRFEEELRKNS